MRTGVVILSIETEGEEIPRGVKSNAGTQSKSSGGDGENVKSDEGE